MFLLVIQNLSLYNETPFEYNGRKVMILENLDTIKLLGKYGFLTYLTPGHHPSCICYRKDNYLFTGDSYIPYVKVVTNLPMGNKKLASDSLNRIKCLVEKDGLIVMPRHHVM